MKRNKLKNVLTITISFSIIQKYQLLNIGEIKMENSVRVANLNNLYFARKGFYNGQEVTVTHRDPKSGQLWLEDYVVSKKSPVEVGCWVDAESVTYKDGEQREKKQSHKRNQKKIHKNG
jgi:hypothetical protein